MIDFSLTNAFFTWFGSANKKSWLDRALINNNWLIKGVWILQALGRKNSDHRPIVLKSAKSFEGPKSFKFFHCWLDDMQMVSQMEFIWAADSSRCIHSKLKSLKYFVKKWKATRIGNLDDNIAE